MHSLGEFTPLEQHQFQSEDLGFANHCNCSNDNEDYSARLVMKPAPDLYDGQEYVLVTIVNNGVVTHQSFSRASYAMVAGWPWWLGLVITHIPLIFCVLCLWRKRKVGSPLVDSMHLQSI